MAIGNQGQQGFGDSSFATFFEAGNTILNSKGMFTYTSLPPTLGGLVSTLGITAAGTDSAGNAYLPGNTEYFNIGSAYLAIQTYQGSLFLLQNASFNGAWTTYGEINVGGGPSMQFSPGSSTSFFFNATVPLFSGIHALANQGSAPAAIAGKTQILGSNADLAQTVGANGTVGFLQASQSDVASHTVTSTSFTNVTNVWTIPASAATVGDVYEIEVYGTGTEASGTAQAFRIGLALNGTIINMCTIAAPAAAGGAFGWKAKARFAILTSTTFEMETDCLAGAGGTSTPIENLTTASGAITLSNSNTLAIQVQWVGVTGMPTMSGLVNYFKKVS